MGSVPRGRERDLMIGGSSKRMFDMNPDPVIVDATDAPAYSVMYQVITIRCNSVPQFRTPYFQVGNVNLTTRYLCHTVSSPQCRASDAFVFLGCLSTGMSGPARVPDILDATLSLFDALAAGHPSGPEPLGARNSPSQLNNPKRQTPSTRPSHRGWCLMLTLTRPAPASASASPSDHCSGTN